MTDRGQYPTAALKFLRLSVSPLRTNGLLRCVLACCSFGAVPAQFAPGHAQIGRTPFPLAPKSFVQSRHLVAAQISPPLKNAAQQIPPALCQSKYG